MLQRSWDGGGSQISSVPNSRPSACAVTKKGSTLRQLGLKYELRSTLIGTSSHMYSGHSFRRGGASFALECGLPTEVIKAQGDWTSNAYESYICPSQDMRRQLAATLGRHIR